MELIETTRVVENEIARADDLEFAFTSMFGNYEKFTKALCGLNTNFLIGGSITKASSWNFTVSPLIGICINNNQIAINSASQELTITAADSMKSRVDSIFIKGSIINTNEQSRAIYNSTEATVKATGVLTHHVLNVEYIIETGTPSYSYAPTIAESNLTDVIKIAEIVVPAGVTSITDCEIYPVTKDLESNENDWTVDKSVTTKIYNLFELQKLFRVAHNQDGSIANNVISENNLNLGTSTNQVNLDTFSLGVPMYNNEVAADKPLKELIATIKGKIDGKSDNGHTHSSLTDGTNTVLIPSKSGTIATTDDIKTENITLNNYSKATDYSSINSTDTINQAIGKLELANEGRVILWSNEEYTSLGHTYYFSKNKNNGLENLLATKDIMQGIVHFEKLSDTIRSSWHLVNDTDRYLLIVEVDGKSETGQTSSGCNIYIAPGDNYCLYKYSSFFIYRTLAIELCEAGYDPTDNEK